MTVKTKKYLPRIATSIGSLILTFPVDEEHDEVLRCDNKMTSVTV
tara:strand:- start:449 stop:583 length:135 start_codon:yes stop_codon:yes gene_type:complete